jgi:glycosyltransferase involved in cell wall biosynthesis
MMDHAPRVSIGLPVYNGDRFIEQAIDSILEQTLEDLELIISDNASTDRTQEMCQRYADKDDRVRYVRNRHNLGAAFNYNQTFHLSSGMYFKWAAHDDALRPEFLERCADALDGDPDAVIAYPRWQAIDEKGQPRDYQYARWDVSSELPVRRFQNAMSLAGRGSVPIFGLIRSDVLWKTGLHPPYPHGDHVLLAELSLYGRFIEVPEALQLHRWHAGRYVRTSSAAERVAWWAPDKGRQVAALDALRFAFLPVPRRGVGHLRGIMRSPISRAEKMRCTAEFVRWGCGKVWERVQRRSQERTPSPDGG